MGRRPAEDPTPREIAERCAEIQAGWSEETRRKRQVTQPDAWSVPVYPEYFPVANASGSSPVQAVYRHRSEGNEPPSEIVGGPGRDGESEDATPEWLIRLSLKDG